MILAHLDLAASQSALLVHMVRLARVCVHTSAAAVISKLHSLTMLMCMVNFCF